MLDAVIFDLDGLLIDSEPLQFRSFNMVFSRFGFPMSEAMFRRWRDGKVFQDWIDHHGVDADPEALRQEKKVIYDRMIVEDVELKPGADRLVRELAGRHPLAIASGSRHESIESCLGKFGLLEFFSVRVSAVDVARGKPAPDIFIETGNRLGARPSRTVVIENAASGLRGAVDAGMHCVVCPDPFAPDPAHELEPASLVVESLEQLSHEHLAGLVTPGETRP